MFDKHCLAGLTAIGILGLPQDAAFMRMVEEGRPSAAQQFAEHMADASPGGRPAALWWQASGDMALLAGNAQEAHSAYGQSLRGLTGADAAAFAGRATARQVLHGSSGLASPLAQSFWTQPLEVGTWLRAEQLCGLALMCKKAAWVRTAQRLARTLLREACEAGAPEVALLARELGEECDLREAIGRSRAFSDHVYWTSTDRSATEAPSTPMRYDLHAGAATSAIWPILRNRARQRHRLVHVLEHAVDPGLPSGSPGPTGISQPQKACEYAAIHQQGDQLEAVLLALAMNRAGEADALLGPLLQSIPAAGGDPFMESELRYALSKLYAMQGRQSDSLDMYRQYASLSVQRVRLTHGALQRLLQAHDAILNVTLATDDVSARLPARYKRAYQRMLARIGDPELSVRDIAVSIGVSERALQMAFKRHVGHSPTEILRRLRVERIHATLAISSAAPGLIREVAGRFGIGSRTTLSTAYRKHYSQVPSMTLDSSV